MTQTPGAKPTQPIHTVGELIERLREFDAAASIRTQHALDGSTNSIVGLGESPNEPGTIAIVFA